MRRRRHVAPPPYPRTTAGQRALRARPVLASTAHTPRAVPRAESQAGHAARAHAVAPAPFPAMHAYRGWLHESQGGRVPTSLCFLSIEASRLSRLKKGAAVLLGVGTPATVAASVPSSLLSSSQPPFEPLPPSHAPTKIVRATGPCALAANSLEPSFLRPPPRGLAVQARRRR
jgi:hypothetical protein